MHEAGHPKLVLWDSPEGWDGEGCGRGVQDGGTHVHPWLIHVDIWQKPPQYYKVISLQFKKKKKKKEPTCNARDPGLIAGLGRFPREGNGNTLQYSFLENSTERRACWAIVHGVAKSRTQLSD